MAYREKVQESPLLQFSSAPRVQFATNLLSILLTIAINLYLLIVSPAPEERSVLVLVLGALLLVVTLISNMNFWLSDAIIYRE